MWRLESGRGQSSVWEVCRVTLGIGKLMWLFRNGWGHSGDWEVFGSYR